MNFGISFEDWETRKLKNNLKFYLIGFFSATVFLVILFLCATAHANPVTRIPENKAILAIIGEAENQGLKGMRLVASAIRNRGTLKGVYGLKAERVRKQKYSKKTYAMARMAWKDSINKDYAKGANSWENITAFGKPYWAEMEVLRHKDHVFYYCKEYAKR